MAEAGIAHPSCAHFDQYFGQVGGGGFVLVEEAEHELIVRCGAEAEIEMAILLKQLAAGEEGGVGGHPTVEEVAVAVGAGFPVPDYVEGWGRGDILKVSVEGVGLCVLQLAGYPVEDIGSGVEVIGIEEGKVLPGGVGYAFVHGIVEPIVGFGNDFGDMGVLPGNIKGVVLACAIYDEVLNTGMLLPRYTFQRIRNGGATVVADGDDGECDRNNCAV